LAKPSRKVQANEKWSLRADDEDPDEQTLMFDYPPALRPMRPDTSGAW